MKKETIGEAISPGLVSYESILWDFEANIGGKPNFTDAGFRASIKIFVAALMDKMNDLQVSEGISQPDAEKMAEKCGNDLRNFIRAYTGMDTYQLFEK